MEIDKFIISPDGLRLPGYIEEYLDILKPIFPNIKYPSELRGKSNIRKAEVLGNAVNSGSELE